jgi:membrane-associated phospholipid phosphatase
VKFQALAALVAFSFLTLLVALGAFTELDRAILGVAQTPHARWIDIAASLVTVAGQSEVIGAITLGVAVARLRARRSDWWVPLPVALVVAIELVCKFLVPQEPPPDALARSVEFVPFLRSPTPFAFPSGHMARVAFLVTALRGPPMLAAAIVLVVAVTRLYLAEHWPSDVVGGALLGYGIAALALDRVRPQVGRRARIA